LYPVVPADVSDDAKKTAA
jgi:pimeloyl-ACP methyl ester carboxylesterase